MKSLIHLLIKDFANLANKNIDVVMPGFTHLKNAQPVLFSHYLLAYVEMFKRDHTKFQNVIDNLDENPLGSGALAGTSYNIDRNLTTKLLGFKSPTKNSIDSVSDRDYAIEFLFVSSLCAMHLSRLAEEIILWNSDLLNFIKIKDSLLTGSSMMPQKKNPDSAELIRGKTGGIYGNLNALLITMKGLPLSYFKDMQEDKEPVFDAADSLALALAAITGMVTDMQAVPENMRAAAGKGYSTATDLADWLVRAAGVPFRDAHGITGAVVKRAEEQGIDLADLPLTEMQAIDPRITDDVFGVLSVEASVASRTSFGGTAPDNVRAAVADARARFTGG